MRHRASLALAALALALAGCLGSGGGTTVFEVNGRTYELVGFGSYSIESHVKSEQVRVGDHDLRVIDDRVLLDGRDRGPVAPGAPIRLESGGGLFVDGKAR